MTTTTKDNSQKTRKTGTRQKNIQTVKHVTSLSTAQLNALMSKFSIGDLDKITKAIEKAKTNVSKAVLAQKQKQMLKLQKEIESLT